ncbi:Cof-type HAD-IIB family hydrolase [Salinibacterium sp. GXW1014]|uniref:Cof-type HAD-IIB family hydrolase n=1 Tax=Salinibacterium sp. GXW1014 TaxID=3377838 RepID=UPI00383B2A0E
MARPWTSIPPGPHDIRLVVCDMDGSLLTDDGNVPESFWPLLEVMQSRGIAFVPASGRQYATLSEVFSRVPGDLTYVAENGNLVVQGGKVLSSTAMDAATVQRVIETVRHSEKNLGLVVCGLASAYIDNSEPAFLAEAQKYYARLETVADLMDVSDDVLKLAICDFTDAEDTAGTTFRELAETHQVVVSGKRWVDIMNDGVDKGRGVRKLQEASGVTPARTVVFGDYLNDLQMLDAADWSFAMANAHPTVRDNARYLAPSNQEHGVVTALEHLLGI